MTKENQLLLNGNPVDFTYTNELTPIEHHFIKEYFFNNPDYDKMVDYLEDCVLWKRQNYFVPIKKIRTKGFKK